MPKVQRYLVDILNSVARVRAFLSLAVVSVAAIYVLSIPAGVGVEVNAQCGGECTPSTCCDYECSLECCLMDPYEYQCMQQCFICWNVCSYCCV
jgi:hypothetical protein